MDLDEMLAASGISQGGGAKTKLALLHLLEGLMWVSQPL